MRTHKTTLLKPLTLNYKAALANFYLICVIVLSC